MKGRTARLSVGAAGLVVLWIVTFWWMDSDPTIRFDENATTSPNRAAPPALRSGRLSDVRRSSAADVATAPASIQPKTPIAQQPTITTPEIKPDRAPQQPRETIETRLYTIVPGDLLSRIAQREYGSIRYTAFLFEHNRERLGLSSPDAIREGQVLEIPPLDDTAAAGGG